MKLAYCTNIWNHHQGPVCAELARLLGPDNFRLLLHQPLDHKYSLARINMGWNLKPPDEPWIVGPPKTCAETDYSEYVKIAMEADVIVFSSDFPYMTWDMLSSRRRQGKLNLRMGERLFKVARPWYWRFCPRKQLARLIIARRFRRAGLHFLTMGHWCADDLRYYYVCEGRIWRWGYLVPTSARCVEKAPSSGRKIRLGWCGRMLYWKQVDYLIRAYAMLPLEIRMRSEVHLVGAGEAEDSLRAVAQQLQVADSVYFEPFKAQADAMAFLESLDIFVFSSNRLEGWGATLVEAMDKGCCVIANESAGATLEVIRHGENGFVFRQGEVGRLAGYLAEAIADDAKRVQMGRRAWETVQNWSPENGAKALISLSWNLLNHGEMETREGLCGRVG